MILRGQKQRIGNALKLAALAGCCALASLAATSPEASAIVKKKFINPVRVEPPAGTKADFIADRVVYDEKTQTAIATGTVEITYGPYTLTATKVTYNKRTGAFSANGTVVLREPNGNVLKAETLFLKNKFKEGFARHLQALLTNNASISSIYAVRRADGTTTYEKAHYTACTGCVTRSGKPLWEIVSERTVHDEKSKTLYHTVPRLQIGGVTVGAIPYAAMPDPTVKRRTGFLVPTFKAGDLYGFSPITPFYWAPAPNYDMTFSPMWSFQQGPVADVEWRHRLNQGSYWIRGYGLYQMGLSNNHKRDHEWRGAAKTGGKFKLTSDGDWRWGWQGTVATDRTFLRDYSFDSSYVGYDNLYVTGLWDQTYIDVRALAHSALSTSVDWDRMPVAAPYVTGSHVFDDPVLGGQLNLDFSSYSLWRDTSYSPFSGVEHGTSQSRAVVDVRWEKQIINDIGQVVTPFVKMRGDVYVSDALPDGGGVTDSETTVRVLPAAGVDMRWPFVGESFGGQSVISPVMQVIAATNETDSDAFGNEDAITLNFDHTSLFLDDRFTGFDRYEGGTRINAGLTYSYFGSGGASVRASFGESFHVDGKNSFSSGSGLDGSKSDLVAGISASPFPWLTLNYEGRMEEDLSEFNRHEALLGLSFDRFTGHAGYQFIDAEPEYGRKSSEEFAFANARYMLSEGWYAFGGMSYDLASDFFRSTTLGVEFDCDCMNAKLAYSQSKSSAVSDTDYRLTFSIELATLGRTRFATKF